MKNNKTIPTFWILTSLLIARSKHQKASASSSSSIIIGEHISFIPKQKYMISYHTVVTSLSNQDGLYLEHNQYQDSTMCI